MALLSSYPSDRATYIGYFELIAGLGALLGPLLGSFFYSIFGYKGPYFGIGLLYLICILFYAPHKRRLDLKLSRQLIAPEERGRTLTFTEITSVLRSAFGFMVQLLTYLVMSFNVPLISNHLTEQGYSPVFTGVSMAAVSIAYIAAMPLVFYLSDRLSRRGVIIIGLTLLLNGMLITGLDKVYNFENPGFFTIIGLAVFGVGFAQISIPVMPEILEAIEEE